MNRLNFSCPAFWMLAVICCVSTNWAEARVWTSQDGRQLEGTFVSADDRAVKVRRESDGYVFSIPLTRLSKDDQRFVAQKVKVENPGPTPYDPFAHNNQRTGWNVQVVKKAPASSESLGEGQTPNRLEIPSLSTRELGKDYPNRACAFLNFLLYWNETIAPDLLRYEDQEKAVKNIKRKLEDYVEAESRDASLLERYSEFEGRDYILRRMSTEIVPSREAFAKWTDGWYGVVVYFGFYEVRRTAGSEKEGTVRV